MNKTIYIRDEDEQIWDRARELAGARGISSVLVQGLRDFITAKEAEEAEAKGFERITVEFNDAEAHFLPKVKAFHGRWIIPPTAMSRVHGDDGVLCSAAVAITRKGSVVIYWTELDAEGMACHFGVYPSFESAAADSRVNWAVREAVRTMGVPVEELDI